MEFSDEREEGQAWPEGVPKPGAGVRERMVAHAGERGRSTRLDSCDVLLDRGATPTASPSLSQ